MLHSTLQALFLAFFAVAISASPDPRNWGKSWTVNYNEGIEWDGGESVALNHASNACYGFNGQRGFYQSMYFKSWADSPHTANLCVNTYGSHVNFEIGNLNPSASFTLNPADCYGQLRAIITGNRRGGETQYKGWYYRADPNAGNC